MTVLLRWLLEKAMLAGREGDILTEEKTADGSGN